MINDMQMEDLLVGQEVVVCGNDEVKDYIGRVVGFNNVNIQVRHPFDLQNRWYTRSELFIRPSSLDDTGHEWQKIANCIPGGNKRNGCELDNHSRQEIIDETRKSLAELNVRLMEMQKRGMSFKMYTSWSPELQITMTCTEDPFGARS